MIIYVYHMLQSCGVQTGRYPKTEVINEIHLLASKELYLLGNLVFLLPKLDYHQCLKVHIFSFWEIQIYRRIQNVGSIVKTV